MVPFKNNGTTFSPHGTMIPFKKKQCFLELKELGTISKFLLSYWSTYYIPQKDFVVSFLSHCLMAAIFKKI